MRKVIVSGGNGFIGSSLVSRLRAEGIEVHALIGKGCDRLAAILPPTCIHELRDGPASAVQVVTRIQPDTILHLAAVSAELKSVDDLLSMLEANLMLGACLLFAATQCARKPVFVNTGTYWQYDTNFSYAPNTLYAATKQAFQDLLVFYRERLGIASVTLILYDIFGEQDTRRKLWHHILISPAGASLQLSGGEQTIHLVHIDDVVEAFVSATTMLHGGALLLPVYSVHAARTWRLRSLVEQLNETAQLELNLQWGALPYLDGQIFQPGVGEPLPGWRPRVDVLQALVEIASRNRLFMGSSEEQVSRNRAVDSE